MSNEEGIVEWQYDAITKLFRIIFRKGQDVFGDLATSKEGVKQLIVLLQEALAYAEQSDQVMNKLQSQYPIDGVGPALWQAPPESGIAKLGEEPI